MVNGRQRHRLRCDRAASGQAIGLEALEGRTLLSTGWIEPGTTVSLPFDPSPLALNLNPARYAAEHVARQINLDDFRADPRFSWVDGRGYAAVIIDTGIDRDHPFFGADGNNNGVADRIVYSYDFANRDSDASDDDGHGSHVSSIIGSSDPTYLGVAPAVNIIHLKVFKQDENNETFADDRDIERALKWVVSNAKRYNIASVNMSLGTPTFYESYVQGWYSQTLEQLADLGVSVVAAAGNSYKLSGSQRGVSYPAADPNVLAVGAVYGKSFGRQGRGANATYTAPDRVTVFSQRTTSIWQIFAPGSPIAGATADGGVYTEEGTSQAAPQVAGVAVLMQQLADRILGRRLTLNEMRDLMMRTGKRIIDGDDERDPVQNTGAAFRRIDVIAMANAVWSMAGPEARLLMAASATSITALTDGLAKVGFGSTTMGTSVVKSFTIENTGTKLLRLSNLRVPNGFSVAAGFSDRSLAPGESATFDIRLDGAVVGVIEGEVVFTTNDRDERQYSYTVTGSTRSILATLDDGSAGSATTGPWTIGSGGIGNDHRTRAADAAAGAATWTFSKLIPGTYRVWTTWTPSPDLASNARFTLADGNGHRSVKVVDQRVQPDDLEIARVAWEELGTIAVDSSELTVQLGGLANGKLLADSVRIERIGTLPGGARLSVSMGAAPIARDEGEQQFGSTASGRPILRTFIIRNVGSQMLTLDQDLELPEGFTIATPSVSRLSPGTSTTLTIRLDAGAPGTYTGTIVLLSDDRSHPEFGIAVTGTVNPVVRVIDDGDTGFSTVGAWTTTNAGYRNDGRTAGPGASAAATWALNNLTAGLYRIMVTWAGGETPDPSRASNANYRMNLGEGVSIETSVDQRTAPSDQQIQNIWWMDLGEFRVSGTTLAVQLANLADGLVNADAIRIERIDN